MPSFVGVKAKREIDLQHEVGETMTLRVRNPDTQLIELRLTIQGGQLMTLLRGQPVNADAGLIVWETLDGELKSVVTEYLAEMDSPPGAQDFLYRRTLRNRMRSLVGLLPR